jgi:hypothetical protein
VLKLELGVVKLGLETGFGLVLKLELGVVKLGLETGFGLVLKLELGVVKLGFRLPTLLSFTANARSTKLFSVKKISAAAIAMTANVVDGILVFIAIK